MDQSGDLGTGSDWHYHTMKDADGCVLWHGQYDLYALWQHFGIPDDLAGQSVIDIGTASGFFAFECEKRGASPVVATELADISAWDAREHVEYGGVNIPRANQEDFQHLHRLFDSAVTLHYGSINQPLHETLGQFDWVIFGSLMTHLRDPMLALENVRLLTKGRAVVVSSYLPGATSPSLQWIKTPRPFDWWVPSKPLVPEMLGSVGFRRVEEIGDFTLVPADGTEHKQACWHAFP